MMLGTYGHSTVRELETRKARDARITAKRAALIARLNELAKAVK